MNYSGSYFDYKHYRFKKKIKFFSTPGGNTVFLSMIDIEPSELWSHAHKVHVFFPQRNFMEESTAFFHAFLTHLTNLMRLEMRPTHKFYLHFMETEPEEVDAFVRYLMSVTSAYCDFLKQSGGDVKPSSIVTQVRGYPKAIRFSIDPPWYYREASWIVDPDTSAGFWDLAMMLTKWDGEETRLYLSENTEIDMVITKKHVKNGTEDIPKDKLFAISTILHSVEPRILRDIIDPKADKIDAHALLDFVEFKGKFADIPADSIRAKHQQTFAASYQMSLSAYHQLEEAGEKVYIPFLNNGGTNDESDQ